MSHKQNNNKLDMINPQRLELCYLNYFLLEYSRVTNRVLKCLFVINKYV